MFGSSRASRSLSRNVGSAVQGCWRQLYALYGDDPQGWPEFTNLRDGIRNASRDMAEGLVMRTNAVGVHQVLEGRVLRALLSLPQQAAAASQPVPAFARENDEDRGADIHRIRAAFRQHAAFETLAASSQLCTVGGEAHWLVEGIEGLRPGAPGVDSNRLTAEHANACDRGRHSRRDSVAPAGPYRPAAAGAGQASLPGEDAEELAAHSVLQSYFPDARFIFLWRDPRENVSSIMEAWRSGRWRTYPKLEGFDGPWSMLLPPPGWRAMNGRPLAEIARVAMGTNQCPYRR